MTSLFQIRVGAPHSLNSNRISWNRKQAECFFRVCYEKYTPFSSTNDQISQISKYISILFPNPTLFVNNYSSIYTYKFFVSIYVTTTLKNNHRDSIVRSFRRKIIMKNYLNSILKKKSYR